MGDERWEEMRDEGKSESLNQKSIMNCVTIVVH